MEAHASKNPSTRSRTQDQKKRKTKIYATTSTLSVIRDPQHVTANNVNPKQVAEVGEAAVDLEEAEEATDNVALNVVRNAIRTTIVSVHQNKIGVNTADEVQQKTTITPVSEIMEEKTKMSHALLSEMIKLLNKN